MHDFPCTIILTFNKKRFKKKYKREPRNNDNKPSGRRRRMKRRRRQLFGFGGGGSLILWFISHFLQLSAGSWRAWTCSNPSVSPRSPEGCGGSRAAGGHSAPPGPAQPPLGAQQPLVPCGSLWVRVAAIPWERRSCPQLSPGVLGAPTALGTPLLPSHHPGSAVTARKSRDTQSHKEKKKKEKKEKKKQKKVEKRFLKKKQKKVAIFLIKQQL